MASGADVNAEAATAGAQPRPGGAWVPSSRRNGGRGGGGRGGNGGGGKNARGRGGKNNNNSNNNAGGRERPTHFVAVRLTGSPELQAAIKRAHGLIEAAGGGRTLVDAEAAHLTLGVLALRAGAGGVGVGVGVGVGDDELEDLEEMDDVSRCAARLAEGLPGALERVGFSGAAAAAAGGGGAQGGGGGGGGGLTLHLGGLGSFDGGRVLFMNVLGRAGVAEVNGEATAAGGQAGGAEGDSNGGGAPPPPPSAAAAEGFRRLALLQAAVRDLVREWDTEVEKAPEQQPAAAEAGGEGGGGGGAAADRAPAAAAAAAAAADTPAPSSSSGGRGGARRPKPPRPFNPHLTIAKNWFVPGRRRANQKFRLDRLLLLPPPPPPPAGAGGQGEAGEPAAAATEAASGSGGGGAADDAARLATALGLRDAAQGPFEVTVSEVLLCRMGGRARGQFYVVEAAVPLLPLPA